MAHDVPMPKVAMAMNEGTVTEWAKAEGEHVEKGDHLLTIETEKTAYELDAPASGLLHIISDVGDVVPTEEIIGYLAESAEELAELQAAPKPEPVGEAVPVVATLAAGTTPPPAAAQSYQAVQGPTAVSAARAGVANEGRIIASPLAKRIAGDKGIDLRYVAGSGSNGRIKKRDVEAFEAKGGMAVVGAAGGIEAPLTLKGTIPLRGMRKAIADNMMGSLQTTAQLTHMSDLDATRLKSYRDIVNQKAEDLGGKISFQSIFVMAMARAAKKVPISNAAIVGDEVHVFENVNVGIAIALPGMSEWDSGLIVPVIRNADRKSLAQIDRELRSLVEKARNGTLDPADTQESTITLSSASNFCPGWGISTPVLNAPNAVLVQPGNIARRPWVVGDDIEVRDVLTLSITFDHRIMDGVPFGNFCNALHDYLTNPEYLAL